MSAVQKKFEEQNTKVTVQLISAWNEINEEISSRLYNFVKFAETGDVSYLKKEMEKQKGEGNPPVKESKENVEPNSQLVSELPKRTARQKNGVLADSTFTSIPQIQIKQEKISTSRRETNLQRKDTNVDTNEQPGEMLAPTALPLKRKKIKEEPIEPVKRSTRTKTKKLLEQSQISSGKPSDVMIQNTTITMIDITEDKESDNEKKRAQKETMAASEIVAETRSTRTKTRQKKQTQEEKQVEQPVVEEPRPKTRKNKRNNEDTEKKVGGKRSKSSSPLDKEENKSALTDYEDAVSNFDSSEVPGSLQPMQVPVLNATMVVEKPRVAKQIEDALDNYRTPPPTKSKKAQIKEIFSPYDKTSLKKKVEAFEKLGSATKTMGSASKIPIKEDANSDPVKSKQFTPFTNKFMPKTTSTSLKQNRTCNSATKDTSVSMKSLSALKASQAEYREMEKRRQEKEKEAQLKKEALLLAQAEEKRRKREEKQLKAQQQRELIQKERERQLEIQKIKEEKYKQAVAEKEEKLQKIKEEAEKKRVLAKNKAKTAKESQTAEEQAIENERNLDKGKTKMDQDYKPIYLTTKAPLLPTDDCYDSDSEEYRKTKYIKPKWSRDDVLKRQLYVQLKAGEKIKNTMFCCQTHSPDLVDIFEQIDPKKLKRTSSAVWKKPPRYTLFSMTSDIHFSEDSEGTTDV